MRTNQIFFRFCFVGALAFGLDSGILTLLKTQWNWHPIYARFSSFSTAVIISWLLNRRFTFASKKHISPLFELWKYLISNSLGFVLNWGVYVCLLLVYPFFYECPVIPLIFATMVSSLFNFYCMKKYVFN